MLDQWRTLLDRVTRPGDLATILVAGTLAYTFEAAYNPLGFFDAGQTGVAAASGALGVKKAVEALLQGDEEDVDERLRQEWEDRGDALRERLKEDGHPDLAGEIDQELSLLKDGITSHDQFESVYNYVVDAYRKRLSDSREGEDRDQND
jgi:hypothetical protein